MALFSFAHRYANNISLSKTDNNLNISKLRYIRAMLKLRVADMCIKHGGSQIFRINDESMRLNWNSLLGVAADYWNYCVFRHCKIRFLCRLFSIYWLMCVWVSMCAMEREQRSKNLIPIMFIKLSLSIQLNILNGFPITFNEKKKPIKFVTLISQFVIEFHFSCRKLVSFHGAFKRAFGFVAQLFFLSLEFCVRSALFKQSRKAPWWHWTKKNLKIKSHIFGIQFNVKSNKSKNIKARKWAEKNLIPKRTACYRNKCQKRHIVGLFIHVAIIKTNRYKIPHRMPTITATISFNTSEISVAAYKHANDYFMIFSVDSEWISSGQAPICFRVFVLYAAFFMAKQNESGNMRNHFIMNECIWFQYSRYQEVAVSTEQRGVRVLIRMNNICIDSMKLLVAIFFREALDERSERAHTYFYYVCFICYSISFFAGHCQWNLFAVQKSHSLKRKLHFGLVWFGLLSKCSMATKTNGYKERTRVSIWFSFRAGKMFRIRYRLSSLFN